MINTDGQCWCGQQWDGEKMCAPKSTPILEKTAAQSIRDAPITSAYIVSDNKLA